MKTDRTVFDEDFQRCADFHGHVCPGLAIGYRAARVGLDRLKENRSLDEEILSIVENDACGTDAVQVLTGCTFGKGNFIFKDHGKSVFTFCSRDSGKGVRVALRPGALEPNQRHQELMGRVREERATPQEQEEFEALHLEQCRAVLEKPVEDLFEIRESDVEMPPKARVEPSKPCELCGEPTMGSKMIEKDGLRICRGCIDKD